ncbi:MAG: HNH endonuclease [Hyphomonadaceae bacterium]|nr:HNH endonuclease [Hyphomonadaceae bacterium]
MHDTNMFLRMPASGSTAGQPQNEELLHRFDEEREVAFKEETYLVRDNGAVLRRARPGVRRRKLDEFWTFGSPNKQTGYLVVCDHVVHRIVATAFHGPSPSAEHVVDHIDTNRQNNRAENLRWVTRLENVLLNPITRARIEFAHGSLEAFFENPGAASVPNLDWMRTVTKEEAAQSLARLRKWAEEGRAPTGGVLGDWVFTPRRTEPKSFEAKLRPPSAAGAAAWRLDSAQQSKDEVPPADTPSLTPGALQRNWGTPTEFPQCPQIVSATALDDYLARLTAGAVFARNRYGESTVVEAGRTPDFLSVVCKTASGVKDWSAAKIFVEGDTICHQSGGTFFTKEGATKAHLRALGVAFDEALFESIDDYA